MELVELEQTIHLVTSEEHQVVEAVVIKAVEAEAKASLLLAQVGAGVGRVASVPKAGVSSAAAGAGAAAGGGTGEAL
jgi:uncharacterized spore protein YtfJ